MLDCQGVQESLTLLYECNVYKESVAASLEGLAALEAGQGEPRQAVRLWGAAEALREAIGAPMHPVHRASYEQSIALARGVNVYPSALANALHRFPEVAEYRVIVTREGTMDEIALQYDPILVTAYDVVHYEG